MARKGICSPGQTGKSIIPRTLGRVLRKALVPQQRKQSSSDWTLLSTFLIDQKAKSKRIKLFQGLYLHPKTKFKKTYRNKKLSELPKANFTMSDIQRLPGIPTSRETWPVRRRISKTDPERSQRLKLAKNDIKSYLRDFPGSPVLNPRPMQGTWVQSLVWEDPTCCGATELLQPMLSSPWAANTEPTHGSHCYN